MQIKDKRGSSFVEIVGVIGAVLIFLGVVWLVATNWHDIPDFLKIIILVFATLISFVLGVLIKEGDHPNIGKALLVLGAFLYIASIFLIAQIYFTDTSAQGFAWLLLLCWLGIVLSSYALGSVENLVVGLLSFLVWFIVQFIAFAESSDINIGIFAFGALGIGILFYGLNLLHKSHNHKFAKVYQFWSVFYFLTIAYVLTFQALLPSFWENGFSFGGISLFVLLLSSAAVLVLLVGVFSALSKSKVKLNEILFFIGVVFVFCLLFCFTWLTTGVTGSCYPLSCYDFNSASECVNAPSELDCEWSTGEPQEFCKQVSCYDFDTQNACEDASLQTDCVWEEDFCSVNRAQESSTYSLCNDYNNQREDCLSQDFCRWKSSFNYRGELPGATWFVWILINLFFIGLVILILNYGTHIGSKAIINVGIGFFILDIISRYIGFIMRFSGYTGLAVLFILGGVILLGGGWAVSKWRSRLIKESSMYDRGSHERHE